MKRLLSFLFILFAFSACEKIKYFPDKIIDIQPGKILAHRAGGNAVFRDNSLEAIKAALKIRDGIEVDVQISEDETIWLSHSAMVEGCNKTLDCFAETSDNEIRLITTCNGLNIQYTQLEKVLEFMQDSFPDKLISIDLKSWTPCGIQSFDVEGVMKLEAEKILQLAQKYGLENNTMFETETASVLNHLKSKKAKTGLYLTSFGDFERAMLLCLKESYQGISFKNNAGGVLQKDMIDLLHRKGLKMMVWNLRNSSEIPGLKEMGVDFIQEDL